MCQGIILSHIHNRQFDKQHDINVIIWKNGINHLDLKVLIVGSISTTFSLRICPSHVERPGTKNGRRHNISVHPKKGLDGIAIKATCQSSALCSKVKSCWEGNVLLHLAAKKNTFLQLHGPESLRLCWGEARRQ